MQQQIKQHQSPLQAPLSPAVHAAPPQLSPYAKDKQSMQALDVLRSDARRSMQTVQPKQLVLPKQETLVRSKYFPVSR